MKKYIAAVLIICLLLVGCSSVEPINEVNAADNEIAQIPYTVNIDTVKQGEITYKKLVIHNRTEYSNTEESIIERSKELLQEVYAEYDPGGYGEINIIFYKDNSMYCVVDGISKEISYLK